VRKRVHRCWLASQAECNRGNIDVGRIEYGGRSYIARGTVRQYRVHFAAFQSELNILRAPRGHGLKDDADRPMNILQDDLSRVIL
jgi:hypothetical protein